MWTRVSNYKLSPHAFQKIHNQPLWQGALAVLVELATNGTRGSTVSYPHSASPLRHSFSLGMNPPAPRLPPQGTQLFFDCTFNMLYTQIIEPSIGMLALAHLSARMLAVKTVYGQALSALLTHPWFRQQNFDRHIRKAGLLFLWTVSSLIRLGISFNSKLDTFQKTGKAVNLHAYQTPTRQRHAVL